MIQKIGLAKPLSKMESRFFLVTLTLCLLDSITTLTIHIMNIGFEMNPILRQLLEVNAFLAYPFLLSFLLAIFVFRFNIVAEYGVMILLSSIHLFALANNMDVIFYRYALVSRLSGGALGTQFLAFLIGLIFVSGSSLYRSISKRENRFSTIRNVTANYAAYLGAFLLLNLISVAWLTGVR